MWFAFSQSFDWSFNSSVSCFLCFCFSNPFDIFSFMRRTKIIKSSASLFILLLLLQKVVWTDYFFFHLSIIFLWKFNSFFIYYHCLFYLCNYIFFRGKSLEPLFFHNVPLLTLTRSLFLVFCLSSNLLSKIPMHNDV